MDGGQWQFKLAGLGVPRELAVWTSWTRELLAGEREASGLRQEHTSELGKKQGPARPEPAGKPGGGEVGGEGLGKGTAWRP